MYKLTYDSEDNDEVNAPKSSPTQRQLSPSGYDVKMKIDAKDAKENGAAEVSSPQQKKTKDVGTYEGNGRFYSLFANDNFLTEDTKKKKRLCCFGIKTILFIATIIVLILAILGLMWVVRGLQVEQDNLKYRIKKLEEGSTSSGSLSSSAGYEESPPGAAEAPPLPVFVGDVNAQCCTSNKEQIDYINDILRSHSGTFKSLESKIQRYYNKGEVRETEMTRVMMENKAEAGRANSKIATLKSRVNEVEKTANTAKQLATFSLKDTEMTEEEVDTYLESLNNQYSQQDENGIAFSVAHAMGSEHVAIKGPDVMSDTRSQPPLPFYDVGSHFAPVISFTEEIIDGGDYIEPESGTFTVPVTGNYVLLVSFCVHSNRDTSVHLIRNEKLLREMEISSDSSEKSPSDPSYDPSLIPPPAYDPAFHTSVHSDAPATPSSDDIIYVRPYQFSDVTPLEEGDTIHLKINKGSIVEYTHLPGKDAAESCTRFAGFKL